MKGKAKRVLSGILSVMTILTSAVQPVTVFAAEPEPAAYEAEYLALEKVQAELSEDEIVIADDYEMTAGEDFEVEKDFSGMEIRQEKVKVTFHEAKDEGGQDFDKNRAGIYQAVYFVEPVSGNPSYHVTRKIIVKESSVKSQTGKSSGGETGQSEESESEEGESETHSETAVEAAAEQEEPESETAQTEPAQENTQTVETETEGASETEGLSESELDKALEAVKGQDTVDEETGLTLGDVMLQAVEQGVDIRELESGESVQFTAKAKMARAARASQSVKITQGTSYYYADYGLGSYLTSPFTVTFGNVTATAFCIEPSKPGPGSGNYEITKLSGKKELAKVCYYGTEASGDAYFFAKKHKDFSEGKRFVVTHLAASYANVILSISLYTFSSRNF